MIKYNVRSRQLIDIVGDIKRGQIILSPYFQRNLVWRLIHKQDFIKTILLGYPFPQIFLAKGGIDVDNMTSISLIVDGQQRMNSIIEFIDGAFDVDGKFFKDLIDEKTSFLTYEVAIIELQMESDDPQIKDVFKRLNRTFYSLTSIEKLSTEYAPSEFMLVAKVLTKEIELKHPKEENHSIDPNVPDAFVSWAIKKKVDNFNTLILESSVFTKYEISRKVHLQVILNVLATIERGFFNRNIPTSMLEEYTEVFEDKDDIMERLEKSAKVYLEMKLPAESYWYNKANFFSILIYIYNHYDRLKDKYSAQEMCEKLIEFEAELPAAYQLAAKEAVNNKKERQTRNRFLDELFLKPVSLGLF